MKGSVSAVCSSAGLAFADTEQQHRDDRGCGQRDLFGRLGGEIGPGEPVEGLGQAMRLCGGHGMIPERSI